MRAVEVEVADGAGDDAYGVAGQVGDVDLVDVHDLDALGGGSGGDGQVDGLGAAWSRTSSRVSRELVTNRRSTSPPIWPMAAPMALATPWCSGMRTSGTPGSVGGMRMLPPPTMMTGSGSAVSRI